MRIYARLIYRERIKSVNKLICYLKENRENTRSGPVQGSTGVESHTGHPYSLLQASFLVETLHDFLVIYLGSKSSVWTDETYKNSFF